MKKFILTKKQLAEYVDHKKSEKVFYDIVETIYLNNKFLKENVSKANINQDIVSSFRKRGLVTPTINEMLIKHKIINNFESIL